MKKAIALLLSLSMIFALSACGSQNSGNNTENTRSGSESTETIAETTTEAVIETPTEASTEVPTEASTEPVTEESMENTESAEGKTLVVYFSATGNTEEAANYIAAATGADMLELVPVEPYSSDDLDWTDDSSRVVYEHDNPDARVVELVESTVADWESYDTIFIGYPHLVGNRGMAGGRLYCSE